jgi:glycine amidinotransferase
MRRIFAAGTAPRAAAAAAGFRRHASKASATPVVNSFNEWDVLEEVIVGRVDGAHLPEWFVSGQAVWPQSWHHVFKEQGGQPFPQWLIDGASEELEHFCALLRAEGVVVRRPDAGDSGAPYQTPDFASSSGMYAAMPRDVLLVVGNELIEAPMAWRSRFFEYRHYRALIKEYFEADARVRWTSAPKPQMGDASYNADWAAFDRSDPSAFTSAITEFEPMFDAPDFVRCGADIFCQQSQVTNQLGIEWLRRHLGPTYTIHQLDFGDAQAMHIDATFVPLEPGRLLINPTRPCVTGTHVTQYRWQGELREYRLPQMFEGWEILVPPAPLCSVAGGGPADFLNDASTKVFFDVDSTYPCLTSSPWTAVVNVLLLGDRRVVCEASQLPTIEFFEQIGYRVIRCPFMHFLPFGGSFHCATTDVRRRGGLESYF